MVKMIHNAIMYFAYDVMLKANCAVSLWLLVSDITDNIVSQGLVKNQGTKYLTSNKIGWIYRGYDLRVVATCHVPLSIGSNMLIPSFAVLFLWMLAIFWGDLSDMILMPNIAPLHVHVLLFGDVNALRPWLSMQQGEVLPAWGV